MAGPRMLPLEAAAGFVVGNSSPGGQAGGNRRLRTGARQPATTPLAGLRDRRRFEVSSGVVQGRSEHEMGSGNGRSAVSNRVAGKRGAATATGDAGVSFDSSDDYI